MATLVNARSGERLETTCSNAEAARLFAEAYGADNGNWLWFWIHRSIRGRTPAVAARGEQSRKTIRLLGDMFLLAMGRGLKRPMIRLHFQGQRFKIYLSQRGTLCLKTGRLVETGRKCGCGPLGNCDPARCPKVVIAWGHNPIGDEEYAGCWSNGMWLVARTRYQDHRTGRWVDGPERPLTPTEVEFLRRLEADPIAFMAECSKDMNRCCYCNQPLEDERSKEVGYGPICAGRYGLRWGTGKGQHVPSFAEVYCDDAAAMLAAIREKPTDPDRWAVFSDWIEERGLPPVKCPETKVAVPRS